jgi:asparagine synthase (glutamine-hydrolysing)
MVTFGAAALRAPGALDRMGRSLSHRGPDDRQLLVDPRAALGTERLRITDPTPDAAQPFTDPSTRVWLSCNGAIYNAEALRTQYATYPFRSDSDVEPLLPLYLDLGVEAVAQIDGMFAIAVWDMNAQHLILARDRSGEKPLFYTNIDDEVWFASELQPLLEHPSLVRRLDRRALADYLRLGYAREPRTMLTGIRKVEAGTAIVFSARSTRVHRYWRPESIEPQDIAVPEARERLALLLQTAVAKQVVADVPVGVFTSGGLDSSLLALLASQARGTLGLHTFAVGFPDPSYDERAYAAQLAGYVGSRHIEVTADDDRLRDALDTISTRVAEPVADPAMLPTYLLAQAAREHVGVVLSGEGADELLGGYPTYVGHRLAPRFTSLPGLARRAIRSLVGRLPPSHAKVPLEFLLKRFTAHAAAGVLERHVAWFGTGLDTRVFLDRPLDDGDELFDYLPAEHDALRRVMLFDYRTYLPDNLLAKVDRATMLVSLEARSPFLDRDVVAFALGLPTELKVRKTHTKWLLKQLGERWLPQAIVRRRKRGLSVPVARWLNGRLRDYLDRLLAPERVRDGGLLDPALVAQLISEHRGNRANHARALWTLLILERWRERWLGA